MHGLLRLSVLFAVTFLSVNTHLHSFVVVCVCTVYNAKNWALHIFHILL